MRTDMAHSKARIAEIESSAIGPSLEAGNVAVVAGFQGISDDGRISTLGRGGSDTSAVDETMEERVVSGVAYSRDEAQITLLRLADKPGMVAKVCGAMSEAGIIVDMIVQGISRADTAANLTFTVGKRDLDKALRALESAKGEIGFEAIKSDDAMFDALAERNINVKVIATSEIKISVLIDAEYTELAVRALHSAFELHEAAPLKVSAP